MSIIPAIRVQVWFDISCHGLYRDIWRVDFSGFVLDTESIREALAQVGTQRSASSFEFHAQHLLIEHFISNEEPVQIEVYDQGAMISLNWNSTIRQFTNRTYYVSFSNVSGVNFNIQDIPESP